MYYTLALLLLGYSFAAAGCVGWLVFRFTPGAHRPGGLVVWLYIGVGACAALAGGAAVFMAGTASIMFGLPVCVGLSLFVMALPRKWYVWAAYLGLVQIGTVLYTVAGYMSAPFLLAALGFGFSTVAVYVVAARNAIRAKTLVWVMGWLGMVVLVLADIQQYKAIYRHAVSDFGEAQAYMVGGQTTTLYFTTLAGLTAMTAKAHNQPELLRMALVGYVCGAICLLAVAEVVGVTQPASPYLGGGALVGTVIGAFRRSPRAPQALPK